MKHQLNGTENNPVFVELCDYCETLQAEYEKDGKFICSECLKTRGETNV